MSDDSNEGGLPTEFDHPSAGRCTADRSKLAIRWSGGVTVAERDALLERLELELAATGSEEEAATDGRRRPGERVNQTEGLSWVTRADGARISRSTIRDLEASTEVDWISLAFRTGAGGEELASLFGVNPTRVYVSDELRGRLDDLQAGGVPVRIDARRSARLRGSLALAIEQASVADGRTSIEASADIEAALAREGIGNAFVRLENIPFLSPACQAGRCGPSTEDLLPNDPEFPDQWGLRRIQAPRAWHLTDGDPDIVVAVIDEGVELGHPDLSLHPQSWNASSDTPDGGPVGSHGTPCAGIVAGTIDNGIGVSGVAGRCRIMAVATATWSDIDIAEGLYFAVDNGARVVSMSFGVYPSWGYWDFDVIRDALQYALDRGLVLVAASGNENRAQARFPGSDSRTLCVGGTNRADLRKSVGDSSSEPFWGASFGPDLDVVAPCLEIPSTDRLGAAGYADGDYMDDFNGTSSAAPHVAGLAALIVSLRPDLSNETVREIIERTCDKVGPSTYDYALVAGKPNGSWHEEVGYGRINVERALLYACDHGRDAGGCGAGCGDDTPPAECRSPAAPPWKPYDQSLTWLEPRYVHVPDQRCQLRVVVEHGLRAQGRQQGSLLYTTTLLPGETTRLYHYDRFRRVRSDSQRVSVHTSLRQTAAALWEARTFGRETEYQEYLSTVRSDDDSSATVGGMLFPVSWRVDDPDPAVRELLVGASLERIASDFQSILTTASQQVDAEHSLVVSTYEETEERDVTSRTLTNANDCYAVTYFVRRVLECYRLTSRAVQVEWRCPDARQRTYGPWRPIEELDEKHRRIFAPFLEDLPRVGDTVESPTVITVPTEGAVYESELAHCSSCEPAREKRIQLDLAQASASVRRAQLELESLELEVERRRALLEKGELEPFEVAESGSDSDEET